MGNAAIDDCIFASVFDQDILHVETVDRHLLRSQCASLAKEEVGDLTHLLVALQLSHKDLVFVVHVVE
jgi:hypothetical protein